MKYIAVNDNKVTNIIQSSKSLEEVKLIFPEAEKIYEIDKSVPIYKGIDIRIFKSNWEKKPLLQLVDEGLLEVPEGCEIKDNILQPIPPPEPPKKTREEEAQEYKKYKIQELSELCYQKRYEIIDDIRIINIMIGATKGYPEHLTKENVMLLIEYFKEIYHTAFKEINKCYYIPQVDKVMENLVFPTPENILEKLNDYKTED